MNVEGPFSVQLTYLDPETRQPVALYDPASSLRAALALLSAQCLALAERDINAGFEVHDTAGKLAVVLVRGTIFPVAEQPTVTVLERKDYPSDGTCWEGVTLLGQLFLATYRDGWLHWCVRDGAAGEQVQRRQVGPHGHHEMDLETLKHHLTGKVSFQ